MAYEYKTFLFEIRMLNKYVKVTEFTTVALDLINSIIDCTINSIVDGSFW